MDREEAADATPHVPVGFTILGQVIAHDVTADRSPLQHHEDLGLKEAEVLHNGARLDVIGGRMVAEVILGLLDGGCDPPAP